MKLGWLRHFSLPVAMVLLMAMPAAPAVAAADNAYAVHPLVSNVAGAAPTTDPNLVNAWGLTASPTSPWWVADNGTSLSTLYRADGSIVPLVVQVPTHPTGAVFWATGVRARFVFDTEGGQVRGWLPVQGNQTVVLADRSSVGAIYKGLALATTAEELGSQFERDTGNKVVAKFTPGPVVKRDIDAGDAFDLAISITPVIDVLITDLDL